MPNNQVCCCEQSNPKIIRSTEALCPVCKRRLPAAYVREEQSVNLWRNCPEHGDFSVPVWCNYFDFSTWIKNAPVLREGENPACPSGCGFCADHKQGTCCVLLPVTSRCNLRCRYCFADPDGTADKPLDEIKESLKKLSVPGQTLVQLSGGEPTLREDLTDIVAGAKSAGCRYVQLNTNGIRLAEDKFLAEDLANAGLSFVFLQFDSLNDDVYEKLRGRPLRAIKEKAIANCAEHRIGVTIVPTLVPGVNTQEIGDIIRFAVLNSPAVRGVHFQPVSYFGRSPLPPQSAPRYTMDELLHDIADQSAGLVKADDFSPSRCDHPLCGLHGDFIVLPDRNLKALHNYKNAAEESCCCDPDAAAKNRAFVGRYWQRSQVYSTEPRSGEGSPLDEENCCCGEPDLTDMEQFAARVKSHGFTITAMTFQDAATLDIARLRQCSLHVFDNGRHVPFCSYYL
jgi:uncharacterized radical SAM superfamily Fe-S cluster-containing enzyme